jgi:small subunit ribosomal protein S17
MAIGLDVAQPPEPENPDEYDYETCPFYGELPVRGQVIEGEVASTEMDKTVIVEREYDVSLPKYDRLMKRRSRIPAHVPGVLRGLSVGDTVKIAETRPLSKTKSHVVVEVVESEAGTASEQASGESREQNGGDA